MKTLHHKKDYIWRKPHTRISKTGVVTHIPGSWVKSVRTSHYDWAKKEESKLKKSHSISLKKYGTISCPKGQVSRVGYVRKSYVRSSPTGKMISVKRTIVPCSCISDRGLPGKGPRTIKGKLASIGPVRKGVLKKYGYSIDASAKTRHGAIRRAIKAYGRNSVMKKINSIYVWFKNSNKRISAIAQRDKNWIKKNYPKVK
jgi:hypothetical protein